MSGIYVDVRSTDGTDPGDGVRRPSEASEAPANDAGASALQGVEDFMGKGYLLEEQDDAKVFKYIDEIVQRQEQLAKNRDAARKHRARIRSNVPFSTLNKDEDRGVWIAELPPGATDQPSPIPNKANSLCRRTASQIIVDLPMPDPKPATDSEQDRGSADLAKRFLKTDGDESGTNDAELFRDILDSAQTDASDFAHVWTDPHGDGWRPLRIKAHPQAQDPNNPLVALDPMTGQEVPTSDYVLRYVSQQGQFTENAAEAAMQWMPKERRDVLGPQNVRTIPVTADVASADAVILLMVGTIAELRRRVPELKQWQDAELAQLAEWKPRRAKVLIPEALRGQYKDQQKDAGKLNAGDDTLVFWYHKYCRVGPDYPDGADIMISGANGGLLLNKETLRTDAPDDEGGSVVILADIPVSQCKCLHDSQGRDPFGKTALDDYGSTNEGLANLYGAVQVDTDKRLNPNTFIPSTSPVQNWQLTQRNGEPILVYSKDDMPTYEQFGDLAPFVPQVIQALEKSMEDAAGLGSTAQNLNTPDAVSGKAKSIELNQAKVSLAAQYQNFAAFVKRYYRIKLQTAQRRLTIPQQVDYAGADQAYKQRWWSGRDFGGVKNVAIMAGTGTMMTQQEKQGLLQIAQQNGWIDVDEGAEVGRSSVADDMGLRASPHEDTIKRELAQWMEGPPEAQEQTDPMAPPAPDWGQQMQAYQAEQAQIQMAAQANPGAPPPQGTMPMPWSPFLPRPTDDDPSVALKQYKILRDFIASSDYTKQDPLWRSLVDQRYVQARQAAGVQTMAEQAMAAQQQAMMQGQKDQMQADEKGKDRDLKRDEGAANRDAKLQIQQRAA